MNYETAIVALTKYGPLTKYRYNWYKLAKTAIKNNEARVIRRKWSNVERELSVVHSPDIQKECTYEGCTTTIITAKNDKLIFEITVYNGDSAFGHRTSSRCEFVVEFDILNIMVRDAIYERIREVAEQEIEQEDLAKLKAREEKRYEELLAGLTEIVETV